jgi:hypothetical protein
MPDVDPITIRRALATRPRTAFAAFAEPASWWPLEDRNVLGSGSTLSFEDGHLVERNADQRVEWAEVVEWDEPRLVRLAFHPFLPREDATDLAVTFKAVPGGTDVELVHDGWDALQGDASSVATGWHEALSAFAEVVEGEALTIARAYHEGWSGGDFDRAIRLLSSRLDVETPVNEYPDRDSFAEALRGFGSLARRVELLSALGGPQEATLVYDMDVAGLGELRVAEHFTVHDGQIARLRQIHDTAELRAAGFGG